MRGLYACLLVWLMPTSSTQDKTTCRVRPVNLTEETSLTCYFPHDVSVSKKDFTVYHYLDGKQPVSVLDCLWLSGGLKCFTTSGYEYNHLVSSQVRVRIPSVTLNHTGKYSCQISGSNPEDLEFCRLFLTLGKTSCQVPEVEPAADTNLTCYFPEDISLSQRDFAVYRFKDQKTSELVVDCSWTGGESKCTAQPGYQVDPKISDHVTVNIRQASQVHTGTYLCGFLDDRPDTSLSCSFQLKHLGNVLPERKAQELSGHNTEATTTAIIVLAIATSVLLLWVVLRRFLWRRLRCSQTTQESQKEENRIPRVKICRVLCSCAPPLTANDVNEGQHVQPVQTSRAGWKQDSALTCPTSLLAWSRRKRVPRNQAEETGETENLLFGDLSHKQFAPEKTSNGDESFHQTVRSDKTETGEAGFSEPDPSSLKQDSAIVSQSPKSESAVAAFVADDDMVNEISKDRKGESEDISAKTKTMEERSQPENVFAADGEKCSTVINTDADQETGKQGAQSVGDTVPSPPQETQPSTPSNADGENQSRDMKTETMGTIGGNKLNMDPTNADEEEKEKDKKQPSSKNEDISAKTKTMEERSQPENVFAADGEKCSTVINTDADQETGKQGAQSVGGTAPSPPQETQPSTPSNADGENQSRDMKTETMGTIGGNKLNMDPTNADEEEKEKDKKQPSSKNEDKNAKTKTMEETSQPENVFAADGEKCSTVINTDTDQETGKQGAQSVGGTPDSPPQEETQPSTPSNADGENQSSDVKTETMGMLGGSKLHMYPTNANEEQKGKDKKRPSSKNKISKLGSSKSTGSAGLSPHFKGIKDTVAVNREPGSASTMPFPVLGPLPTIFNR